MKTGKILLALRTWANHKRLEALYLKFLEKKGIFLSYKNSNEIFPLLSDYKKLCPLNFCTKIPLFFFSHMTTKGGETDINNS